MNANRLYIILLTLYAVGLVILDVFGLVWYFNAKSLVHELFYLGVVVSLTHGNLTKKEDRIFNRTKDDWFFRILLSVHFTLAFFNVLDATSAALVKWDYEFKPCTCLSLAEKIIDSDRQYGEVERLIYGSSINAMHYALWLFASTALFYFIIRKISRSIESQ